MFAVRKAAVTGSQWLMGGIRSRIRCQIEHPVYHSGRQLCTAAEGDDHYPLTYREAVSYLEDVLQIPDWQKLVEVDPLLFLGRVTAKTKCRIPFTIIPFYSRGLSNQVPSLEECKESMFTRQGGNCTIINTFTEAVLKQLGLQTYCFPASSYRLGGSHVITHVGIIVKNLTEPGSLHLCDPGSRIPTFETVPLDFESSSPVYLQYQHHMKYFKASLGAINLCRRVDNAILGKQKLPALFHYEDGHFWEELFIYNIYDARSLSFINDFVRNLPGEVNFMKIVDSGKIFIYGFPDGLLVDISLTRCLTIDENGVKKVTRINDLADLLENVPKFFPQVHLDRAARAAEYLIKLNALQP